MSDYSESATRFAGDAAAHEMVILHDDGTYRHLVFREPSHGFYWFELITTPGQLVFSGDGNSYVFRRSPDMFEFFRSGIWRDGSRNINPGYWSEKLASGREAATSYSEKLFEEEVAETLSAVEDDYPGIKTAWTEHVESEFNIEYEEEARRAVSEFRFGEARRAKCRACDWEFEDESFTAAVSKATAHRRAEGEKHSTHITDLTFTFNDMDEVQFQAFDWWFLWACQAIVWGIARHDRVSRYGLKALATPKAVAA
jgi:molybdopterin converting factor small subunit